MENIDIKIQDIYNELECFNLAKERFRPYTENFISKTVRKFEGFNSDSIKKIKDTMENMTDTNAPKALEKAQSLYDAAKSLADIYVSLEKSITVSISDE